MATSAGNYATSTTYSNRYGGPVFAPVGSTNISAYDQSGYTAPSRVGGSMASSASVPAPQQGSGAYGAVPGPTAIPPSTYSQSRGVLPSLPALTAKTGQDVMNELNGVLSPETINNIQTHAAQFGVTNGMPGSGLQGNQGLASLGLTTEAMQQQGQQAYGSLLNSLSGTQLNPSLISDIQTHNADLRAAPNPQQAAQLMQSLAQGPKGYGGTQITPPNTDLGGGNDAALNYPSYSGGPVGTLQTSSPYVSDPSQVYANWLKQGGLQGNTIGGGGGDDAYDFDPKYGTDPATAIA